MERIRLICRMCLQCNDLVNIFSESVKNSGLYKMINVHLGQNVSEEDDMPEFICVPCIKIICDFDVYCIRAAENQDYLRKHFTVIQMNNTKELVPAVDVQNGNTQKALKKKIPNNEPLSNKKERKKGLRSKKSKTETEVNDTKPETPEEMTPIKTDPMLSMVPLCYVDEVILPVDDIGADMDYGSGNLESEKTPSSFENNESDIIDNDEEHHMETVVSGTENVNKIFHNYCTSETEPGDSDGNIPEHMKPLINNYPRILMKDGKVVVRTWRMHDMLKKFYILKCDLCPEEEASKLEFKTINRLFSHYKKCHGTEGYVKCCDKKFSERSEITFHMVWHIQPSAFRCSVCGRKVAKPTYLLSHMKCHEGKVLKPTDQFRCEDCGIRMKSKHFLEIHKLKMHSDYGEDYLERDINEPNPNYPGFPKSIMKNGEVAIRGDRLTELINKFFTFVCDICTEFESFPDFSALLEHYQNVHSTRGYATCCGSKFKRRTYLIYHMARHLDPDAFKCRYCGKIIEKLGKLRDHMTLHKSEKERAYFCTQCPRRYATQGGLEKHMVSHIPKDQRIKYPCQHCSKIFDHQSGLLSHLKGSHENQKHICHVCGRVFKNTLVFKQHARVHDPGYVPRQHKKKNPKPHTLKSPKPPRILKRIGRVCPYCHLEFFTKKGIIEHVDGKHAGSHKCPHCSYANTKYELCLRHMALNHLLERKYVCNICGAHFAYEYKLNSHMNGHTKEKIYRCQFCGKEYISPSGFCRHGRECHSEEYKRLKNQKLAKKKLKQVSPEDKVEESANNSIEEVNLSAHATVGDSEEHNELKDQQPQIKTEPPEEAVEENAAPINTIDDFDFSFLLRTDCA